MERKGLVRRGVVGVVGSDVWLLNGIAEPLICEGRDNIYTDKGLWHPYLGRGLQDKSRRG